MATLFLSELVRQKTHCFVLVDKCRQKETHAQNCYVNKLHANLLKYPNFLIIHYHYLLLMSSWFPVLALNPYTIHFELAPAIHLQSAVNVVLFFN